MRPRSVLRGATGLLFPLAVAGAVAAVLGWLAGEPVGGALVGMAVGVLLLGMLVAAALTTLAVVRRQWWWAGALVALWPVTVPLYLRHLRRRPAGTGGMVPDEPSEGPEV